MECDAYETRENISVSERKTCKFSQKKSDEHKTIEVNDRLSWLTLT